MPADFWINLAWILAGAGALMAVLWALHIPLKDAGLVDVGWSYAIGGAAIYCAIAGDGDVLRRAFVGGLVGVWSLRLGTHLLTDRVLHGEEDGRYAWLRERLGTRFTALMLPFFLAQAVTVALLATPFAIAAGAAAGFPTVWDAVAIGLCVIGVAGESIADMQLRRWKRRADAKGKTCKAGLWRYSRHPNYFFEWIIWCGFGALALSYGVWGLVGLVSPALILFLVTKVTGIPPTEARAVRSRGDDYREYQRTTSAFFPWFPRAAG